MNNDGFTDQRVKHLEMIQGVISRMAANSGTMKRYSIVLVAASISFARFVSDPLFLWMPIGLLAVFAFLDTHYLSLERAYRKLFDEVRNERKNAPPDFRLPPKTESGNFFEAALSWSIWPFYLMFFIIVFSAMKFIGVVS